MPDENSFNEFLSWYVNFKNVLFEVAIFPSFGVVGAGKYLLKSNSS